MPKDPKSLSEDEDEQTSIKIDLTPPAAPAEGAGLGDDEDEPTKVLDWDRAMKKSLEKQEPALPATGGVRRAERSKDKPPQK